MQKVWKLSRGQEEERKENVVNRGADAAAGLGGRMSQGGAVSSSYPGP